jgi:hypothetical protein
MDAHEQHLTTAIDGWLDAYHGSLPAAIASVMFFLTTCCFHLASKGIKYPRNSNPFGGGEGRVKDRRQGSSM